MGTTCHFCGREVASSDAELTGLGLRCKACSLQAQIAEHKGASDVAAHFDEDARKRMRASARKDFLRGLGLIAIGFPIGMIGAQRAGGLCLVGGVGMIIKARVQLRHAAGKRAF